MLLVIQGIGNILCDPENATEDIEVVDIDDEVLFCLGNLATNAIQEFLGAHECNAYCEVVTLPGKEYKMNVKHAKNESKCWRCKNYIVSAFLRIKIIFIFYWSSVPFLTKKKIFLSQNFLSFPSPQPFIFF